MKYFLSFLIALSLLGASNPVQASGYPTYPVYVEPVPSQAHAEAEVDNGRVRAVAIAIAEAEHPTTRQDDYYSNSVPYGYDSYYGSAYSPDPYQWMPYSYSYDPSYYDNYPQHDPYYAQDRFYNPVVVPENYDTTQWNSNNYPVAYGADPAPWYDSWRYYINPRYWLSSSRSRPEPTYPYTDERLIPIQYQGQTCYYDPMHRTMYYPEGFNYSADFERKLVVKQVIRQGDERHVKRYVYKTNVN